MLVEIAFLEAPAILGAPLAAERGTSHPLSDCSVVSGCSEGRVPLSLLTSCSAGMLLAVIGR